MQEVPVSVHEKIIAVLSPTMDCLRDALCEQLPAAGNRDITRFSGWIHELGTQGIAVTELADELNCVLLRWQGESDNGQLLNCACQLGKALE